MEENIPRLYSLDMPYNCHLSLDEDFTAMNSVSSFLKKVYLIYLKDRVRETEERNRETSIFWFNSQIVSVARAGPD